MRALLTILATAAICAAGFAAALTFAPVADAWSPSSLPPGWTIEHDFGGLDPNCQDAYRIHTPTTFSDLFCTASPTYQQDFDAWVDAHYTAPVTSTAVPPVTTTVVITTTVPAPTTTASTDTSPPPTTTPAPAPAPTTVVTVTTTATPLEQSLQAQIDALTAQIAALTDRVSRLEKAGDAAWLAFQQAIATGSDPAAAAGIARGAFLNAVYGLGSFAPTAG